MSRSRSGDGPRHGRHGGHGRHGEHGRHDGHSMDDLESGHGRRRRHKSGRRSPMLSSPSGSRPQSKSERHGCFNPFEAVKIIIRSNNIMSMWANVLLPMVPIGLAFHWARPEWSLAIFITNYIAMVPAANMLAFCGGELALKLPRVYGALLETTFGAAVELILCCILLFNKQIQVIKGALIGSMLANLLLCTGTCFVVGGLRVTHSEFSEAVTESGGGMLLIAVAALTLPLAFFTSISGVYNITSADLEDRVLHVSRITSVLLLIAYLIYVFFQLKSHHSWFDDMLLEAEKRDKDADEEHLRKKLTWAEAILFTAISITLVTLHALFMVQQIEYIVERGVADAFVGLILVPLVEKFAEHLSAIDEAWDDAMDFALTHIFGATVQTALFVSPIVVIVGWIAQHAQHEQFNMDLNFELYMVVVLVLSVLIIGNFIKDNKSNYLEGALCVIFYVIIAAGTFYYPNPEQSFTAEGESEHAAE